MDSLSKKPDNHQQKIRVWQWITTLAVFFALISGSFLLYHWWQIKQTRAKIQEREQVLSQLEQQEQQNQAKERQQAQQEYQKQQKQLPQVLTLANNPTIHQFFNDLLGGYAYRFAEKENLTAYCLPLKFGGFYSEPKQAENQKFRELGRASFNSVNQQAVISLNQVFLFNKLGYNRYFSTPELYLEIDFANLIKTCSHELSHYIQYVKYGESSCESDLGTNKYIAWLAQEHKQFAKEIYQMITNSNEYSVLEKYWKAIDVSN